MRIYFYALFFIVFACQNDRLGNQNATFGKKEKFTLFKRIILDENQYISIEKPFSKKEVIKLSSVQLYYDFDIEVKNSSIYIEEDQYDDLNLLYNIQKKSMDSVWYNDHIILYKYDF